MKYESAPDIKEEIDYLIDALGFSHIKPRNIHCIRSFDSKSRFYARIWGMPKLFKEVVGIEPHYIIEVHAKHHDKRTKRDQIKTLVHELMHIPKTFSGALLSHRGPHHSINDREVEKIVRAMEQRMIHTTYDR